MKAQNGGSRTLTNGDTLEAQNGAVQGLMSVVPDLNHFYEEQDPDPHQSEWSRTMQTRIRFKVKGRIRIRIKVKRSIRIRINVMRIRKTGSRRKRVRSDNYGTKPKVTSNAEVQKTISLTQTGIILSINLCKVPNGSPSFLLKF